jgi:plastocyanin
MRTLVYVLGVIIIVILLILFFVKPAKAPNNVVSPTPSVLQVPSESSLIIYDDTGFVPNTITVKVGTKITFKNNSLGNFWPASNPHPIHTDYPTTGGCIGSTFDACAPVAPGQEWSFTFGIAGTWGYHDHLNKNKTGTVVVTQ